MTDAPSTPNVELPKAKVKTKSRLSFIWLVPLVSLLIALWLVYSHFAQADIQIEIVFESGEGLIPTRTEVRFQGIEIGKVDQINLQPNTSKVVALVSIKQRFDFLIREHSQFWLVRPQVSASGISGLDTLVTGSYIGLRQGGGSRAKLFTALNEPPAMADDAPGLRLKLVTDDLGSVYEGAPVHYRKIKVGEVLRYQFSKDSHKVIFDVHINPEYSHLVRKQSRFWNSSGVNVQANLSGVKVQTESLSALLIGGISFYTPEHLTDEGAAENGAEYELFNDFDSVEAGVAIKIEFKSAQGLVEGETKIIYKGLTVGVLKKIHLKESLDAVDAEFMMDPRTESVLNKGTQFWLVKPQVSLSGVSGLETLLSGSHIEMQVGEGEARRQFVALEEPPVLTDKAPGLHIMLTAPDLGSIQPGSPIMYRKLVVGEVKSYRLSQGGQQVELNIYIKPEYSHLVRKSTRFWNSSGIRVTGGISGIKVQTDSIAALLRGGISFETPESEREDAFSQNGDQFTLYEDYAKAQIGIAVEIVFDTAEGLEEGKTMVKFKGFTVAVLDKVRFDHALNKVIAQFLFDPRIESGLKKNTQFWLLKPKIGLQGIQGLDTLLSGPYIQMKMGKGAASRKFIALNQAPLDDMSEAGLYLTLEAEQLNSVSEDTPIIFKGISVGRVRQVKLAANNQVEIQIFIEQAYAHLINDSTRFWNLSGLRLDVNFPKVMLQMQSLQTVLQGGISFSTPESANSDKKRARLKKKRFHLFDDQQAALSEGIAIKINFDQSYGLTVGADVRYQGMSVGQVTHLAFSSDFKQVIVDVLMQTQTAPLLNQSTAFWVAQPSFGLAKSEHLDTLITGAYLQLRPGKGKPSYQFQGLNAPPKKGLSAQGLTLTLVTNYLGSLKEGLPVYYRDLPVGKITGYDLSDTADKVYVYLQIAPRYVPLVRSNSKFWNVSGIDLKFGLFSGMDVRVNTLESILEGGIAFATPNNKDMGDAVADNTQFELNAKIEEEWLKWSPQIPLQQGE